MKKRQNKTTVEYGMYCEELLKEERRAVVLGKKGTPRRELNDLLNKLVQTDTGANIPPI